MMRPHLRYLRYVLLHKLYVFAAGVQIARSHSRRYETPRWFWLATLWRLLIHDLSKFRPSEWRPYVANFYGIGEKDWTERRMLHYLKPHEGVLSRESLERARADWEAEKIARRRRFDHAWLMHQHRNNHHWQHWILREDSGVAKVLIPPAAVVDEMVADWIGAGTKILGWPMMHECVAQTVKWFVENQPRIQLREIPRQRVIDTLTHLCEDYNLIAPALAMKMAAETRESIVVTGPLHGGLARVESRR